MSQPVGKNEVILENEFGRAVYTPLAGASLRSLAVQTGGEEIELLTGGAGPFDPRELPPGMGCFIMAPWPNRIRDGVFDHEGRKYFLPVNSPPHAIHGTVAKNPFHVDSSSAATARFSTGLGADWPFEGTLTLEVALDGASLVQTMEIVAADESFPAGFGWHPWFQRDLGSENATVQAQVEARWILDHNMTPTGQTVEPTGVLDLTSPFTPEVGSLDDCFRILSESETLLTWPELELSITSSPELSHLQVYTPAESICIEPQTCAVNAFQLAARGIAGTGIAIVEPGKPLRASTRWAWSSR